jgi:hypothetical protein
MGREAARLYRAGDASGLPLLDHVHGVQLDRLARARLHCESRAAGTGTVSPACSTLSGCPSSWNQKLPSTTCAVAARDDCAAQAVAKLKGVVESEGPDLEPYRLLEASSARERANGEPAEDFERVAR